MRVRIAGQETLQTYNVRTGFGANQDRATSTSLDQDDTTQDQRLHDPLAEFGLFDHQGAQILRRDQQRFYVIDRMYIDECRLA